MPNKLGHFDTAYSFKKHTYHSIRINISQVYILVNPFKSEISPTVPAVCDGLAARIRKCVAFSGPTNCGGGFAWEWSEAE
jgi:hypothetical protein